MQKQKMIDFLKGHFRYNVMNSWNGSTSYAANVKLRNFVPLALRDKAYEILEQGDVFDEINLALTDWGRSNSWQWQADFNGRSGGYIVLYQGGSKPSEYKSYCIRCGQRNLTATTETGTKCGACGETSRIDYKVMPVSTFVSGKGTDMDEDFSEWETYQLEERVKLVKSFDALVLECKRIFLAYCGNYEVKEKTIRVPKKIKILVEKKGATNE